MTSEGYWDRFSRVPERSLNCLPHVRQRNRRYPGAVLSGRSVAASEPHSIHRILVHPSVRGGPYTQPCPCWPGTVARALTEPPRSSAAGTAPANAADARCPARCHAFPPCPYRAARRARARHRRCNRPHNTGGYASASAPRSDARKWLCHDPRIPSPPAALKHGPKLSRPRAVRTLFQIGPHLIELDHHRSSFRLGLLGVGGRELLQPGLDGGG